MSSNRSQRDAVAAALVGFLRGTLPPTTFRAQLAALGDIPDDRYLTEFRDQFTYPGYFDPGALSAQAWAWLVRSLAYLKTEREPEPCAPPSSEDPEQPVMIRLARWHVLGLGVVAALGPLVSWWLPALGVVISFLLFQMFMWRQGAIQDEVNRQKWAFDPFVSEADWLAHRHLVESEHLPEYDPRIHNRPARSWGLLGHLVFALGMVAFAVMLAGMYVFSVFIWPLWLVLMSVQPIPAEGLAATRRT
jgi:hypothetical protein